MLDQTRAFNVLKRAVQLASPGESGEGRLVNIGLRPRTGLPHTDVTRFPALLIGYLVMGMSAGCHEPRNSSLARGGDLGGPKLRP